MKFNILSIYDGKLKTSDFGVRQVKCIACAYTHLYLCGICGVITETNTLVLKAVRV
jgi:hypothetical protein